MGQFPSILKESNNPDAPLHIGGVLSFMQPLCKKISDDEMDLTGWISSRGWTPNESFCPECTEFYQRGLAWKFPSARH
jgi:hypothetical protein